MNKKVKELTETDLATLKKLIEEPEFYFLVYSNKEDNDVLNIAFHSEGNLYQFEYIMYQAMKQDDKLTKCVLSAVAQFMMEKGEVIELPIAPDGPAAPKNNPSNIVN